MAQDLLAQLKHFDESRANLPGEHWLALGAGIALWLGTRRHPWRLVRVLASVAGTLLVARAVTGRDVPPPLARLPYARREARPGDWIG